VDVHIHEMGRHLDEDERLEAPIPRARTPIGLGDRLGQGSVPDRAPVHEESERRAGGTRTIRTGHEPADRDPIHSPLHRHEVFEQAGPEDLIQPRPPTVPGRRFEDPSGPGLEEKARPGTGQSQERDGFGDVRRLGRGRTEEFSPGGNRAEQVPYLHGRASGVPDITDVLETTVARGDLGPGDRPLFPSPKNQLRHDGDGGQGLPAETVGGDVLEVVQRTKLRSGVALEGQLRIRPAHTPTIVAHPNEPGSTLLHVQVDAPGSGVESVLHQLLDDGGRPFDDLAGRDLVDEILGKTLDRAQGILVVSPKGAADTATGVRRSERPPNPLAG
jgi:hypothetical protein